MKKQVQYIVLHCTPLPADSIIESTKQYWQKHQQWKNPGVHNIVSTTGKIEELVLEPTNQCSIKGLKRNSVHFSLVMPDTNDLKEIISRVDVQVQAMMGKVRELKASYPNACVTLEFEVSEN